MITQKELTEDAPVTSTNNGGAGLTDPKLPIKKDNLFKRYKELMSTRNSSNIK